MYLYHGGVETVRTPRLLPSNRRLDFGPGFYTTSDLEQARRWARIKKRRMLANHAVVSIYDAASAFGAASLSVKAFQNADGEWLDFVMANRLSDQPTPVPYDIVRGPVANDTLYETLSLYERGILNRSETVVRLRAHELADQIVFVTSAALACLRYERSEEVQG